MRPLHGLAIRANEPGLGAINLTRAGVGAELPASPATVRVVGLSALAALVFGVLAFASCRDGSTPS